MENRAYRINVLLAAIYLTLKEAFATTRWIF